MTSMYNNGPEQTSATATFKCVLPSWNAARNGQRPLKYTHCDRKLESANSNSAALTRLRTSNQGVALACLEPFPPAQMNARWQKWRRFGHGLYVGICNSHVFHIYIFTKHTYIIFTYNMSAWLVEQTDIFK